MRFPDQFTKRDFYQLKYWTQWSLHLAKKVLDHGSVSGVDDVPKDWQNVFVTAPEIDPSWHVRMQAAFQRFTHNAVSKTINMPSSSTPEDVREAYILAMKSGLKGITVYRDGCRDEQILVA